MGFVIEAALILLGSAAFTVWLHWYKPRRDHRRVQQALEEMDIGDYWNDINHEIRTVNQWPLVKGK